MIHAQPEEQQGTQEQRLEEVVQHPREPAIHQEGEWEERVIVEQQQGQEDRHPLLLDAPVPHGELAQVPLTFWVPVSAWNGVSRRGWAKRG
mgnify:CR=1 FL=1